MSLESFSAGVILGNDVLYDRYFYTVKFCLNLTVFSHTNFVMRFNGQL